MVALRQTHQQTDRTAEAYKRAGGDFTAFKHIMYPRYKEAPFLNVIDRLLMQATLYLETGGRLGYNRIIIEVPVRHGKTLSVSQLFPSWHLGRMPHSRIVLFSYGATLAHANSRLARNFMKSPRYQAIFPNVRLSKDSTAVNSWNLASPHEGGIDAVGMDGGITGKGSHIAIADDLIKNRAEAESERIRGRTWESFLNDFYTRQEPNGVIILMMARWHIDDPVGRAIQMTNENWVRLSLPALAVENDPLGRKPGEALFPARYTAADLRNKREAMGEYAFSSLLQQSPIPRGEGLFDVEHIEIIEQAPQCDEVVRFYDLAVTANKHSDHTAGIKLGVTAREEFIILDLYYVQKKAPDVENDIVANALMDGRDVRIRLEAEKAGIIQLDYLLRRPELRPFTIDKEAPRGDKYTRATPFASRVNAGKVKMVRGLWNRNVLDELSVFPLGGHDDIVDALSGAYEMLSGQHGVEVDYDIASELGNWRGV